MKPEPLRSARQISENFIPAVKPGTILEWGRLGKVPRHKLINGSVMFKLSEIEQHITRYPSNIEKFKVSLPQSLEVNNGSAGDGLLLTKPAGF